MKMVTFEIGEDLAGLIIILALIAWAIVSPESCPMAPR